MCVDTHALDDLWDFDDPAASEARFRQRLIVLVVTFSFRLNSSSVSTGSSTESIGRAGIERATWLMNRPRS